MVADGITADSTMAEILGRLPGAKRALFARYHLGGCSSCAYGPEETLAGLCARSGIDPEEVLAHLRESHEHDRSMLIEPEDAAAREDVRWIDMRTREEHEAVAIPGSEFFTQALQQELFAAKPDGLMVLYDHTGGQVLDHVAWFRGHGLEQAFGLSGGIDAWSRKVDPKLKRYRLEIDG